MSYHGNQSGTDLMNILLMITSQIMEVDQIYMRVLQFCVF